MPRREPLILFGLALAFNLSLAAFVHEPGYPDDAYYFGGALRLVEGAGFTEPYFWNYVGSPASLPAPSHLYWMPLTSIVAATSMAIFGHSFEAARLPLVFAASLLPVVAYVIGWKIRQARRHALGAGLLTIFCGFYAGYWATTDSFGLYGLTASASLLAIGLTAHLRDWRVEIAAGLGAGLAHLTRADGVLLLLVGLALGGWRLFKTPSGPRRPLALLVLGYGLVMAPWFIRNLVVSGSPLGGGGPSTVWLVEYNDLFRYPNELSFARYLAAGWQTIGQSKLEGLILNGQRIVGEEGLFFLTPFVAIGVWRLRGHALYQPIWIYAAGLYVAMTLVFTFPGSYGGLFHSGAALLPGYFAAGLAGIDTVVEWVATRRQNWRADIAKRNYSVMTVAIALGLTLFLAIPRLTRWNGAGDQFRQLVREIPDGAVVMSNNPAGLWVATRHPGIPLVAGDLPHLLAAADRYSATYVLLDRNHAAELEPLYQSGAGAGLRLLDENGEWKVFAVVR